MLRRIEIVEKIRNFCQFSNGKIIAMPINKMVQPFNINQNFVTCLCNTHHRANIHIIKSTNTKRIAHFILRFSFNSLDLSLISFFRFWCCFFFGPHSSNSIKYRFYFVCSFRFFRFDSY